MILSKDARVNRTRETSPANPIFPRAFLHTILERYNSSASVSSRSISDSQSSAHVEHSPVVPHSSHRGAPHIRSM